jgi:hypothetical protein
MLLRTLLSTLFLIAPAFAASPQAEGFKKLNGAQIHQAFTGRKFSDGIHFAYEYQTNGAVQGTGMGKKAASTWKVAKDQLCVTDHSFGETCYLVWKKGAAVKLTVEGSEFSMDGSLK